MVNYSFYALNAKEIGIWINPLFHKNDGYQTPIVLNPMRTNDCIDVNKERKLLSRRLQSNIFIPIEKDRTIEDSLRNLANEKVVRTLLISYDNNYEVSPEKIIKVKKIKQVVVQSLKSIFKINQDNIDSKFYNEAILYIYIKLGKMLERYPKLYKINNRLLR